MTKVIVLSTVLGLSALGMACGEAATNGNANNANKPANTNVAPVSTPATVASPVASPAANTPANANAANTAKPVNAATPAANSAMKPVNAAPSPTKKP
jgi:hypothetical protein